jgi:hypothetical protein
MAIDQAQIDSDSFYAPKEKAEIDALHLAIRALMAQQIEFIEEEIAINRVREILDGPMDDGNS